MRQVLRPADAVAGPEFIRKVFAIRAGITVETIRSARKVEFE
jgi:hypothetical protein